MSLGENSSKNIYSNRTLAGMLAKQYLNSETADIYFRIDSDTSNHNIPAHRCFLAASNPEFHRLFYENLQNSNESDVGIATGTVIIITADASVSGFKEFLQFFYRPNVTIPCYVKTTKFNMVHLFVNVFCTNLLTTTIYSPYSIMPFVMISLI